MGPGGCRYSARIVVSVMFWAPSVPVARFTSTTTWMVASRLGGTVAPVGAMVHVRVMPGSGGGPSHGATTRARKAGS